MAPDRDDPTGDDERRRDEPDATPSADRPAGDAPVTDEQWAEIVAGLADVPDPDGSSGSATAGTGPDDDAQAPSTTTGPAVTYPVAPWVRDPRVVRRSRAEQPEEDDEPAEGGWTPSTGRDWDATAQISEAERSVDESEHFVPPDPGPVLGGDPLLTMAWFAVGGMPLFWLVAVAFWRAVPTALLQASGVVFVLGLAVLLWRMPHRRDDSQDDDTGAVV